MANKSLRGEYQYSKWSVSGNILLVATGVPAFHELTRGQRATLAFACCDSHSGLGADNVIFLEHSQAPNRSHETAVPMRVIEPSGEMASMCGNGLGCAAAHLAQTKGLNRCVCSFSVPDDIAQTHYYKASVRRRSHGIMWDFNSEVGKERSGVGEFIVKANVDAPVIGLTDILDLGIPQAQVYFTVVGEPHIVVIDAGARQLSDLRRVRPEQRVWERGSTSMFPHGTNVMCTTLPYDGCCYYRPFERNGRETSSCSTGAAAILATLCWCNKWPRRRSLRLVGPGGDGLSGPTTWVPHHVARYHAGTIVVGSRAELLSQGSLRFPTDLAPHLVRKHS